MTTTTLPATCDCEACRDLGNETRCTSCGATVTPAHDVLYIGGYTYIENLTGERGFNVCRDCAGPDVVTRIAELTEAFDKQLTAAHQAWNNFRRAERAAADAFRSATTAPAAAHRAAWQAAATEYLRAGGEINPDAYSGFIDLEPSH